MKRGSTPLIVREKPGGATARRHLAPARTAATRMRRQTGQLLRETAWGGGQKVKQHHHTVQQPHARAPQRTKAQPRGAVCTPVFTDPLLTTAQRWRRPEHLLARARTRTAGSSPTVGYCVAPKRNSDASTAWVNPENAVLRGVTSDAPTPRAPSDDSWHPGPGSGVGVFTGSPRSLSQSTCHTNLGVGVTR